MEMMWFVTCFVVRVGDRLDWGNTASKAGTFAPGSGVYFKFGFPLGARAKEAGCGVPKVPNLHVWEAGNRASLTR